MKKQRHKLSLDIECVKDWAVQDALRELFQNAIDWGDWSYAIEGNQLLLRSKGAELTKRSLLIGHSNKPTGSIGKHGEGYKMAALVLCREGYTLNIINKTEDWTPTFIQSRTYKAKQLVFDITTSKCPSEDVLFVVGSLRTEDLAELEKRNLHLKPYHCEHYSDYGNILHNRAGDIFIRGLYVCTLNNFKYGYDFSPKQISLDRDRRLVRDFDVSWLTSQIWQTYDDHDAVLNLISEEAPDVRFLVETYRDTKSSLADSVAKFFTASYGPDAIPVTTDQQKRLAEHQGHTNTVIVPAVQRALIQRSTFYSPPVRRPALDTPFQTIEAFYYKHNEQLSVTALRDLDEILTKAKRWTG